jgi:hypothetical protein
MFRRVADKSMDILQATCGMWTFSGTTRASDYCKGDRRGLVGNRTGAAPLCPCIGG